MKVVDSSMENSQYDQANICLVHFYKSYITIMDIKTLEWVAIGMINVRPADWLGSTLTLLALKAGPCRPHLGLYTGG